MIIAIYHSSRPSFPPTDQHPNAQRVQIGARFVDYVGPAPTQADIDAHLAPPDPATTPLSAEDIERLFRGQGVTKAQIDAAKRARGQPLP